MKKTLSVAAVASIVLLAGFARAPAAGAAVLLVSTDPAHSTSDIFDISKAPAPSETHWSSLSTATDPSRRLRDQPARY